MVNGKMDLVDGELVSVPASDEEAAEIRAVLASATPAVSGNSPPVPSERTKEAAYESSLTAKLEAANERIAKMQAVVDAARHELEAGIMLELNDALIALDALPSSTEEPYCSGCGHPVAWHIKGSCMGRSDSPDYCECSTEDIARDAEHCICTDEDLREDCPDHGDHRATLAPRRTEIAAIVRSEINRGERASYD